MPECSFSLFFEAALCFARGGRPQDLRRADVVCAVSPLICPFAICHNVHPWVQVGVPSVPCQLS